MQLIEAVFDRLPETNLLRKDGSRRYWLGSDITKLKWAKFTPIDVSPEGVGMADEKMYLVELLLNGHAQTYKVYHDLKVVAKVHRS